MCDLTFGIDYYGLGAGTRYKHTDGARDGMLCMTDTVSVDKTGGRFSTGQNETSSIST